MIAIAINYIIVAAGVVALAVKLAEYVDILDARTSLSGAFIGGVMLSAITSLPELFTSLTATIMLHEPGLCMGNILGSNLFNMLVLATMMLIFFKPFKDAKLGKSHTLVTIFTILITICLVLNMNGILCWQLGRLSFTSILILLLYIGGVRFMSSDQSENDPDLKDDYSSLTMKQLLIRFVLAAIFLVALSIALTYITDSLAAELHMGTSLAGALFLGIATSLPELASTVTLFQLRNFNVAAGNIMGSNLFNFIILALADVCWKGPGVYDFSDPKTVLLLTCGIAASLFSLLVLHKQNNFTRLVCPIAVVVCYALFLVL